MYFRVSIIISLAVWLVSCNQSDTKMKVAAAGNEHGMRTLRDDLNYPWEILWGKDDHIWMTERGGRISKIDPNTGETVFSTRLTNVVTNNEGGMLGMIRIELSFYLKVLQNGLFRKQPQVLEHDAHMLLAIG